MTEPRHIKNTIKSDSKRIAHVGVLISLMFFLTSCFSDFDSTIISKEETSQAPTDEPGTPPPASNAIRGVTGSIDSVVDGFLTGSTNPIIAWDSFAGAASYDVTIKDGTGTTTVCPTINTANATYNFSSCSLVDGQTYLIYVTGKSTGGSLTVDASNNGFPFTVDAFKPGPFSIAGVSGGSDSNPDIYLIDTLLNTLSPTVTWSASANADHYDVVIRDVGDTVTLCSALDVVGTTVTPPACVLTDGAQYRIKITAQRNLSPSETEAANSSFFVFRIDNSIPGPFPITGVTGGTDVTVDAWLSGGTNDPTISWTASPGAATYDVVVRNNAGNFIQCSQFGVGSTSASLASCGLTTGSIYRVYLTAKSASGVNVATATNSAAYTFTVDSVVPGAFAISGVTGGGDVTADSWLVNTVNPTISWGTSTDSAGFDITVRDSGDTTTLCSATDHVPTSISLAGCGLTNGQSYRIFISSKNSSGLTFTQASNNNFVFTVDTNVPVANSILGIQGGTDVTNDAWLVLGVNPRVHWNAFTNASSYDVVIRDSLGSSVVCALQNTASLSYNFASCNLTEGTVYRAYVTGKSLSGFNTADASNTAFSFTVDSLQPQAFTISGIRGGADVTNDVWLTAATDPTIVWAASTGATNYDVEIRNSAGAVQLCSSNNVVGTSATLTGCGLVNTGVYRAYVIAKSLSGITTLAATNTSFSFTVDSATPGAFSITGITGATDIAVDTVLASGDLDPRINWAASASAATYDVVVNDLADTTTLCSAMGVAGSPVTIASCGLVNGVVYRVHITAKSVSGMLTTIATNDATFQFTVDTALPQAFTISGITGGGDVTQDIWLNSGSDPTVHWTASTNATSYDVSIRNSGDVATLCSQLGATGTSVSLTGCGLVNGTSYRVHITARSPTGANTLVATNNSYSFSLDNTAPGAFNITGTTGSGDSLVDEWLAGGTLDPAVNFSASSNAASFNITIRDAGDTTTLCSRTAALSSPAAISSCGLTNGQNVRVIVTAVSASGVYTTNATNSLTYNFTVDTSIPGAFNISGITGGSDLTVDSWLWDGTNPIITWTNSSGAASYDVIIRDNANTVTLCQFLAEAGPSVSTTGCGLANGNVYRVRVLANPFSGPLKTPATNDLFAFQVDNTPPGVFNITGVTGGTDAVVDTWLHNGFNPTINYGAATLASTYLIEVRDTLDATFICDAISSSLAASPVGCALSNNTNYKVRVTARSPSLFHTTQATNYGTFGFDVDSPVLGSFSVSGVQGPSDAVTDTWLVGAGDPQIYWSASSNATTYDVEIRNFADDTTICDALGVASSPVNVTGCVLTNGVTYRAKVTAKSISGLNTLAATNNSSYTFTVDTTVPGAFTISGVTGGVSDVTVDTWLTDGVNPSISFTAAAGAASYVVTVRDPTDSFTQCTANVVGSPASLTLCGLSAGLNYKVSIVARSPSTYTTTNATNDLSYTFQLDNTTPGAFTISGIRGGVDVVNDIWLVGGLTPSIAFTASGNASTYDLAIYDNTNSVLVCSLTGVVASPAVVTGCTLTNNTQYAARVRARTVSGLLFNDSTNDGFLFTVDNNTPAAFVITGITGVLYSGDTTADAFLATNGSLVPVVNFQSSAGATRYQVAVLQMDNTVLCQDNNVLVSPYSFTTCTTLVQGVDYRVEVRAFSASGLTFTDATNTNSFTFLTDGSTPAAFRYTGITSSGGGDNTEDTYLSAGLNPRVNWEFQTTATGAWFMDVVILDSTLAVRCQEIDIPTPSGGHSFTGGTCGLIVGQTYTVTVTAKSQSKLKSTVAGVASAPPMNSSYSFIVDNSAPLVTFNITPEVSPHSSTTQTIYGTCSDVGAGIPAGGVRICMKEQNDGTCSFPADYTTTTNCVSGNYSYNATMTPGVWQIQVTATDAANNTGVFPGTNSPNYEIQSVVNDWYPITTSSAPTSRSDHTSIYTGSRMIVWGGANAGVPVNTGGIYNPVNNSWTATDVADPDLPVARHSHSAVWSGTEMIVWGGTNAGGTRENTGAKYLSSGNSWSTVTTTDAPSARSNHTAIWTGSSMIIWGGDDGGVTTNTGAIYDPALDVWTPITTTGAPSARTNHSAVWTGSVMLIFGGESAGTRLGDIYSYTPGGSWSALSTTGAPAIRSNHTAVWTGTTMLVWGGSDGGTLYNSGASFNLGLNSWTAMSTTGAPSARSGHVAAWTSSNRMIVWGGNDGAVTDTGGIYNVSGNSWTSTNVANADRATARSGATAVWAPNMFRMLVFGGSNGSDLNTGGMFAP